MTKKRADMSSTHTQDQKGSVLILILFLLAALSVISVMGYNASSIEMSLAGTNKCTGILKVNAESSALSGSQLLENIITDSIIATQEKATSDTIDRRLINTSWDSPNRPPWLHKGEKNCLAFPENLRNGDINNDGQITIDDGDNRLARARAFSQNYYLNDNSDMKDNWSLKSCAGITDINGHPIETMENAKYMVLEYGIAKTESIKTGLTPMLKKKHYLITGVDERCNGKYMIQLGYTGLVPVSD